MSLMKRIYLSLGAISLFAFGLASFSSPARSATGGDLLTNNQVKELIAKKAKTPADHTKLAKHFDAQADELAAKDREHRQLAEQYRHAGELADEYRPHYSAEMTEHCDRLAEKLSEAADAARSLAHDHEEEARQAKK